MKENLPVSKEKLTKLICIAFGIFACAVFAYIYSFDAAPEKAVRKFWQMSLDKNINEAKSLTASKDDIKSIKPLGVYAGGSNVTHLDGTEIDWVYREEIYNRQIKIDRVTESRKSGYRAGVRLETTDKDKQKSEYIACLGQTSLDDSWKLIRVTLSNVYSKPDTIEDECFEKL